MLINVTILSEDIMVQGFSALKSTIVVFDTLLSIFVRSITLKKKHLSLALKDSDKNLNRSKQTWLMYYFQTVTK